MANFAAVETPNGVARLRDLVLEDVPAIIDYWLSSSDQYFAFLGVDRQRVGGAEEIRIRYLNAVRTGDPVQPTIALALTLNAQLAGYALFVRHSNDVNYCHWHIIAPNLRRRGLSTALYPHRIKALFDIAPISRLIHQTRTSNLPVNRMLDKFVPVAETKIIDQPDGVGLPGEFHLRYVRRADIPRIFARAAQLPAASSAQRRQATAEPAS